MVEQNRNTSSLTDEEEIVIDIIIQGCKRLICKTSGDDPLKYARARSHHKTKSLAHVYTNLHIYDIIQKNPNIRPSDIRKSLPESLQSIRDADLSRILKSTVRTNILLPTEEVKRQRPGHPFSDNNNNKSISGPKSFYKYSDFQNILERVLSKAEVRNIIYNHLLESGLLYVYHVIQGMKAGYMIKENNKEAAWNTIQATKSPNMTSQSVFDEHFSIQNRLLNQDNKNEIRGRAEDRARSVVERHSADDYIYLYRMGGLYYFSSSK
jgi:hypothetical protein